MRWYSFAGLEKPDAKTVPRGCNRGLKESDRAGSWMLRDGRQTTVRDEQEIVGHDRVRVGGAFYQLFKVDRLRRETGRRWSVVLEGFYGALDCRCKGREEEQDPRLPSVAHGVAKISAGVVRGSRRDPDPA